MAATLQDDLSLVPDGLRRVLTAIADATSDIAEILRYADTGKAGGSNNFGVSRSLAVKLRFSLLRRSVSQLSAEPLTRMGMITRNGVQDLQLEADLATDQAVWQRLRESGAVEVGASEETPGETVLNGTGYSVAFDPLVR